MSQYRRDLEHAERLERKRAQVNGLVALKQSWEEAGNIEEVKRLLVKIRVCRQQLIYMSRGEDCQLR